MHWYHWLALLAIIYNILHIIYHIIVYIHVGKFKDYAEKTGNVSRGILYSYTGAMNPFKKESAYMHWPTYIGGIFYHIGIFISILLLILLFSGINIPYAMKIVVAFFLIPSAISGILILAKRIFKKELRALSNPDDYISNILVDIFLVFSIIYLITDGSTAMLYYLSASILLLYLPLGKLKHALYFFAARYHLGLFYGRRNVWPPVKNKYE